MEAFLDHMAFVCLSGAVIGAVLGGWCWLGEKSSTNSGTAISLLNFSLVTAMTKIELIRRYCQAQAPCIDWSDAIIDDLGSIIHAFSKDGNDLTFSKRTVALWAMNEAQAKILEILF